MKLWYLQFIFIKLNILLCAETGYKSRNIMDIFLTLNPQHSTMLVKCPYVLLIHDFLSASLVTTTTIILMVLTLLTMKYYV